MKSLVRSFAGGEITPELFARLDLTKFQTGLAKCLNFEIRPHGPAVNRAGFQYVLETQDSAKKSSLLPFIFSTEQAYILEFGHLYVRFHTLGGTLLETPLGITAITQASVGVLTYTGADPVNGDWMFLSGIGGMTQLNGRYVKVANVNGGANTFELKDLNGVNINTMAYGAYTSGGTAGRVYQIVSPYAEADIPNLEITQSSDVLTITHVGYQTRELKRFGATNWAFNVVTVAPTQVAPTGVTVVNSAAGSLTYTYVVTALAADGREESLKSAEGSDTTSTLLSATVFNTITWTNAAGAIRYNVYRKINGLYGYVGQGTDGTIGFVDSNFIPDASQTPPEADDPISTATNYPGAVGYFQGRRWFAGSTTKPQNTWATRSGTESNMTYSIPTRDSDAITARLTSRQANTILHLVPLNDLLALTSGAEWLINSGGDVGPITPGNIDYRVQGNSGSSRVRPAVTNNSVLYAQNRGGRVREINFSWENQAYKTADVSLMAPHLFDGFTILSMAFARSPNPTLWCVRSDGALLGMTYIPEHQVIAWHQHVTDGFFESVAVIPEGDDDALYAVIQRVVPAGSKRYIERQHERQFASLADSFIVDSGLTYDGANLGATTMTLTNETVTWEAKPTNETWTINGAASIVSATPPYGALPGTLGSYFSTPDSAAVSITGDIDLRMKMAMDDWTPSANRVLMAHATTAGNQQAFFFYITSSGNLAFQTSPDGTDALSVTGTSTVATGVADSAVKWIRGTLDVNDGSGNRVYNFYTSDDGVTWTQLGATVTTAGTTSIFDSNAQLLVGASDAGTFGTWAGRVYYAEVRNGIDGAVVAEFDPQEYLDDISWKAGDDVIVTASAPTFSAGDVGNAVVVNSGVDTVIVTITSFTSTTVVKGTVDRLVPVSLRGVPTLLWSLAVDQLSGFWHLVGKTVSILGDGAVFPQQIVDAAGAVTLSQPVSKASVGQPITAELQTLPMSLEMEAFSQGTLKNVNKLYVRVNASSSLFAGPSFIKLRETKVRTTEPYGSPPKLFSGVVEVTFDPAWSYDAPICIRQSNPLPLTVSGLVPDTAAGG